MMANKQMQVLIDDLVNVHEIELPSHSFSKMASGVLLTWVSRLGGQAHCEVISHEARNGSLTSIDVRLADGSIVRIAARKVASPESYALLEAEDWKFLNGRLLPIGKFAWKQLLPNARNLSATQHYEIGTTWRNALSLKTYMAGGSTAGLRKPQIGALHAIAAHWSIKKTSALVVMPTGTGKTDTMIAAMVMQSPQRTLVLVPSDILRTQLLEKFQTLGVLRNAGVLAEEALNPIVGIATSGVALTEGIEALRMCNVVISTVAMIDQITDEALAAFLELFDVVFVDEVHHAPARSWKRILDKAADCSLVGFSATPFREDAKRIPGTVIYNFPLRLAQELGYFQRIELVLVDEPDLQKADAVIAENAVRILQQDDGRGYKHVILARTSTQKHAEQLLTEIYGPRFPHLNPIALHSNIKGKAKILEGIRNGLHRIIICVDMFGEGFDMPSLKIAALHVIHKSLAITLQFTGRITRSSISVGNATVVANIASDKLSPAIEELYAESADWQELLPRLSETAIGNELQSEEFGLTTKQQDLPDINLFDLLSLRPTLSMVFFRATAFHATSVSNALPRECHLHAQWISEDGDLVICVTKSRRAISWASARDAADEVWELWIVAYDRTRKLLYLNVSSRSSLHIEFAKRITNDSAQLVSGETMFRAFAGVNRLALYNVGLYGKGRLRYRMFVGRDVAEQITSANQANNVKSNLFGSGYEKGARQTIGVSYKGRAWSMDVASVPAWRSWCAHVADKIIDTSIKTDEFLKHTLNPTTIVALPKLKILAVMVPDAWTIGSAPAPSIAVSTSEKVTCRDVYVQSFERRGDSLVVALAYRERTVVEIQLGWGPSEEQQRFSVLSGTQQLTNDGEALSWTDYLTDQPFSVLFEDGSELIGGVHLQRVDGQVILFDVTHAASTDWRDTPFKKESKWKSGQIREKSIQGFWIDELLTRSNKVIFDDDGANESADIVEIDYDDQDIVCKLYHCKYSSSSTPGLRVNDVQEVCAQAVRSAKWADAPDALFSHLQSREAEGRRGGRTTRFERGSLRNLSTLKRLASRRHFRLQVYVVQPALSIKEIDRNISLVLGACDNFVHELTGYPLTVLASD